MTRRVRKIAPPVIEREFRHFVAVRLLEASPDTRSRHIVDWLLDHDAEARASVVKHGDTDLLCYGFRSRDQAQAFAAALDRM